VADKVLPLFNFKKRVSSLLMQESDQSRQRDYYRKTAATYHERHVSVNDEHALALDFLVMLSRR